ncbi:UNVERIFIED_CONTAM: hypothetical protein Slati_3519300 [Sesamum latifolium]|uniref:Retrotransposon gag domain-containing protein n=1 Tax=Sesamum latifolium TaxID=2727402 RepID=A0AAW2UHR4_9LAMI
MENPNQAADKQKAVAAPIATQALQVMTGASPPPMVTGSVPAALPQASLPPRVMGPVADPPHRSTSSDTSTEELSPALLGAIQQIVAAALREHVSVAAPPRLAQPPEAEVLEEEGEEEAPVPVLPAGIRRDISRPEPPEHNNGSTSCLGAIGNFQEFCSLFLHQFASSRKLRKTELSLFAVHQKDDEPLKEYLQRFNTAALEVPAATQEVKVSAFSQGLLDGDFFKSLAKKPVAKFDALLARAAKYINMEERAGPRRRPGEKRKEIKEETPSKKPRVDLREKKPFLKKRLIQNGYLQEYVCWEKARGTGPYQKKDGDKTSNPERSSRDGAKQTSGSKGENDDIPRKGVIHMLAGGPSGGDSHQARKSQVQEAHQISVKEVLDVETMEDAPLIQFGRAERSGPQTMHNDALVITAILANYEVGRIFIDSGSSADILFTGMQLGDVSLEKEKYKATLFNPEGATWTLSVEERRGGDDTQDKAPPNKKGKAPEEKISEATETPAKVQPVEELLNIQIIPGDPDKTTRIGSHLGEEAKKEITLCLQRNGYLRMDPTRLGGD